MATCWNVIARWPNRRWPFADGRIWQEGYWYNGFDANARPQNLIYRRPRMTFGSIRLGHIRPTSGTPFSSRIILPAFYQEMNGYYEAQVWYQGAWSWILRWSEDWFDWTWRRGEILQYTWNQAVFEPPNFGNNPLREPDPFTNESFPTSVEGWWALRRKYNAFGWGWVWEKHYEQQFLPDEIISFRFVCYFELGHTITTTGDWTENQVGWTNSNMPLQDARDAFDALPQPLFANDLDAEEYVIERQPLDPQPA